MLLLYYHTTMHSLSPVKALPLPALQHNRFPHFIGKVVVTVITCTKYETIAGNTTAWYNNAFNKTVYPFPTFITVVLLVSMNFSLVDPTVFPILQN